MPIQNVPRKNVPRDTVPETKHPKDKTSQGTKRPKGQNFPRDKSVPRDKTSYSNYQVFKSKFCVKKLATYVKKWASSVHSIYDWGIPILVRLG